MIRIAIVEDDKNYAETLRRYVTRYEEESGQHFAVTHLTDGEDIANDYSGGYDIILMDIEMRFMDGMTAAEKIRESDKEVVIIFITNMPQYAMKGYAVEALDYVLKPINYYAFSQRIDRALGRMKHRQKHFLNITYMGRMRKVDVSDILYVEVQNHNIFYHTKDGVFQERSTMREVEDRLQGEPFFRCNKCYLINLESVNGVEESDVIVGEEAVQVSRAKKKELLDALNDYMNEVSK